MNDSSSTQGWAICVGAGVLALLFVFGVLSGSYFALAVPVSILTLFVLGLGGWVGYTIATVQASPASIEEPPAAAPLRRDEKPSSSTSA